MISPGALALALTSATPGPASDTLTLAQARAMTVNDLARHLLGAAGIGGNYVEARIHGPGRGLIFRPGLVAIDLFKRPKSAGFEGICMVEGVTVTFTEPKNRRLDDPPLRASDFWHVRRFAVVEKGGDQEARCRARAPVADRLESMFFAAESDRAVDVLFAIRAFDKAKASRVPITCSGFLNPSHCTGQAALVQSLSVAQVRYLKVQRRPNSLGWCATGTWVRSRREGETDELQLSVSTDAAQVDPPVDFGITAVDLTLVTVSEH